MRAENRSKSSFKPPVFSEEQKNEWKKRLEDNYTLFAEINKLAQSNED